MIATQITLKNDLWNLSPHLFALQVTNANISKASEESPPAKESLKRIGQNTGKCIPGNYTEWLARESNHCGLVFKIDCEPCLNINGK